MSRSAHQTDRKHAYRELGLDLLLYALDYLIGTQQLHYGYFSEELEPTLFNLSKAQDAHSKLIIDNLPEGTKRVLDVGCGAGTLAKKLVDAGFEVECVCPSDVLVRRARKLLGDSVTIHKCYFREYQPDRDYDVVIFSESYQYIDLDISLDHSLKLLKPDGHILICDFFKIPAEGKSPFSGGHYLPYFEAKVEERPLKRITDIDITIETSKTMDIFNDFLIRVAQPAKERLFEFAPIWHPWLFKMINWKFKKKFAKMDRKYFNGAKSGANFAKYKSYRLFLYERTDSQ